VKKTISGLVDPTLLVLARRKKRRETEKLDFSSPHPTSHTPHAALRYAPPRHAKETRKKKQNNEKSKWYNAVVGRTSVGSHPFCALPPSPARKWEKKTLQSPVPIDPASALEPAMERVSCHAIANFGESESSLRVERRGPGHGNRSSVENVEISSPLSWGVPVSSPAVFTVP
jgi:hypothetical protein